jgi:hypothetical protein
MSKKAKKEYLAEIRKRYICSAKAGKKQILDEFCAVCGYNRKYAIRLLHKPPYASDLPSKKAGRKSKYHKAAIKSFRMTTSLSPLIPTAIFNAGTSSL